MTIEHIDFVFDAHFPRFTAKLSQELQKAGVEYLSGNISDVQLEPALQILLAEFDSSSFVDEDQIELWELFKDEEDRARAQDKLATELENRPPEVRARLILSEFLRQANTYHDYVEDLWSRGPQAFADLYATEKGKVQDRRDRSDAEADGWRFFNEPEAKADYERWGRLLPWTLDQAVALSFGKNPDVVHSAAMHKPFSVHSLFARRYAERSAYLKSAVDRKELSEQIYPKALVRWGEENNAELPDELVKFSRTHFYADDTLETSAGGPSGDTWRAVVLGMLLAYYDFDLSFDTKSNKKTPFTARVMKDLAEVGIKLSEKTIRPALDAAAEWGREPINEVRRVTKKPDLWRSREERQKRPKGTKSVP